MSFLPLSGSTTSLSTAHSEYSTEVSDTTGYTSEGRRNSFYYVKGNSSAGGNGNERRVDAGEDEDEMREFLLGPGWRDDRVPPAERMKQLYHLLEEHYDLTGGDYYGQCAYHSCGTIGSFRRTSKLVDYPIVCVSYLASIGVNLDLLLGDSNKVSSDPMNDLIDEAFCRPASLYLRYKAGPFSTWEVDWDRPLPQVTHGYWNMMRRTRPKHVHEFARAKPTIGKFQHVVQNPCFPQGNSPPSRGSENSTSRLRVAIHRLRGLVTS